MFPKFASSELVPLHYGVLSFGTKAQFKGHRIHALPLPRGALTVMESYAADSITHAVVSTDVKEKGCSVMMRGCQPAAIAAALGSGETRTEAAAL